MRYVQLAAGVVGVAPVVVKRCRHHRQRVSKIRWFFYLLRVPTLVHVHYLINFSLTLN